MRIIGQPDPGGPHQAGDLIAADVVTGPSGGSPQLACPVDAAVVLPELDQGPAPRSPTEAGKPPLTPNSGKTSIIPTAR